jgi:hypothetical protein
VKPSLQEVLQQLLALEGTRTVALIDIASGMIVRSAGEQDANLLMAAASVADEARTAREALGPRQPAGELDEMTTVTDSRLQLAKILRSQPGEGFLLFVDMDRARANVALASLRVGQFAPTVLA